MSSHYPIYSNGYQIIRKYEKEFVRIFLHDCSHNDFFRNKDEALFSQEKYKQSVLKYVTTNFIVDDNKYEFILQYPELNLNIHWTQETLITEETLNANSNIFIDSDPAPSFSGLAPSYESNWTLLDGSVTNHTPNWWYCIGAYGPLSDTGNRIPGPRVGADGVPVYKVALYIRLNNIMLIDTFPPWKIKCPTLYFGYRNSISYSSFLLLSTSIFHSN